jgi:hypothetical protein
MFQDAPVNDAKETNYVNFDFILLATMSVEHPRLAVRSARGAGALAVGSDG